MWSPDGAGGPPTLLNSASLQELWVNADAPGTEGLHQEAVGGSAPAAPRSEEKGGAGLSGLVNGKNQRRGGTGLAGSALPLHLHIYLLQDLALDLN